MSHVKLVLRSAKVSLIRGGSAGIQIFLYTTFHLPVISVMIIGVMRLSYNKRAVSDGRFRHHLHSCQGGESFMGETAILVAMSGLGG